MHLADTFIQSDLQCIQTIHFTSMCVNWELNPQLFALLTQCSTTKPQEHRPEKCLIYKDLGLSVYFSVLFFSVVDMVGKVVE